jgi:REP element-mobilizing transposase RayT
MPNHFHLLLFGRGESIRKFMQYFLQASSRKINNRVIHQANTGDKRALLYWETFLNHANGTAKSKVWKERFRAVPLNEEDAILTKLNYIHYNPVKRGLVPEPSMWR